MAFLVQQAELSWEAASSPGSTPAFDVLEGDVIVVAAAADAASGLTTWTMTNSGAALVWTLVYDHWMYQQTSVWTTVMDADRAGLVITVTRVGPHPTHPFGANAMTFRNVAAIGNTAGAFMDDPPAARPTLAITTTEAMSVIVLFICAEAGQPTAVRTYLPGPGTFTELTYHDNGYYTIYLGLYSDAGVAGAKTVGLDAVSSTDMTYDIVAVELTDLVIPYDEQTHIEQYTKAR